MRVFGRPFANSSCSDADTTCLHPQIQHFLYVLIRTGAVKVDICVFGDTVATAAIHKQEETRKDGGSVNKEEINKTGLETGCFFAGAVKMF